LEDDISGVVEIRMNKSKKLEHSGVKLELIGSIGKLIKYY
jgi:vacuolar protein sorting-associated protein 26